ncbi:homeobox protein NOBOX [Nematolebias whitei]|uniref:homeobox protein NOBOX n=1 Tax=Nematolebias whitei TaxID=451745 RepID=UPI0018991CD1|nr:homeobox protein NOBOX [Nematolebias whitei]
MSADCHLAEDFDGPSLLCEELEDLETNNSQEANRRRGEGDEEVSNQRGNEETREVAEREETNGREERKENKVVGSKKELMARGDEEEQGKPGRCLEDGESQDVQTEGKEEEEASKEINSDKKETKVTKKGEQKKGRKRRGKKQSEQVRNRRAGKDANKKAEEEKKGETQEVSVMVSEENLALLEPSVSLLSNCDLSDQVYLSFGGTELYCPPIPAPLLYSQPPASIQPAAPQSHKTKRPRSPPQPHSLPQQSSQALEMEITQVYSTRRSVRYSKRGRSLPLLPGSENVDLLLPAPKKKTRTLYSTDQLEHLEALFQDDHYPDADKRKLIAASVGVTPQRIMVWFQNRRAKWRKVHSITAKAESMQSICSPNHNALNALTCYRNGPLSFSGHFAATLPQPAPAASFPTQTPPSFSSLLDTLNSPGHCRGRDVGQHQLSSQGSLPEFHPRPMHSPPPLRRASLPLFTPAYNPISPNPPLLNTPAHTPPLFLDALESGSSLAHCDSQSLQTDTSSLFDFAEKLNYQTSGQQSSTLSYQISYPTGQQQPSLPHMTYLTPSPYLTPNPPDSNPTTYLTFGPGGNSSGVVTYSTGGQTYFPSQRAGQILLQSAGHNGGMPVYPSYPWGNLYSQTAVHQRAPSTFSASLVSSLDHQAPSTSSLPLPSFVPQGDRGSSHLNLQHSSHTRTHTETSTTLRTPSLRAETTPNKVSSLLSSPAKESLAAPPCVKLEYDSPREIHSHFHCDFSPIHF